MSTRPPGIPDPPDPSDAYVRMLAGLEVKLDELLRGQESIKGELRRIAPRLDTLSAEVKENARLIHHQAKVIASVTDEQLGLAQTRIALEKIVEELTTETRSRALMLERTQRLFETSLELVEGRVRRVSDDVADLVNASKQDETSGLMSKPKI